MNDGHTVCKNEVGEKKLKIDLLGLNLKAFVMARDWLAYL